MRTFSHFQIWNFNAHIACLLYVRMLIFASVAVATVCTRMQADARDYERLRAANAGYIFFNNALSEERGACSTCESAWLPE
jgi:hypothetical protein